MNAFLALVALPALVVTSQVNFQLDIKDSTRIGNSFSPGFSPPSLGNDYNFSDIITPGAQVTGLFPGHQNLMLRYAPNFFYLQQLDVPAAMNVTSGTSGAQPTAILHRLQFKYAAGSPHSVGFTSGANVAFGTLELAQLSTVTGAAASDTGTLAQAPTSQRTNYFGLNGFVAFEKDFGHAWKFTNQDVVSFIRSHTQVGNTFNTPSALTTLQPEDFYTARNELARRLNARHFLLLDLQLSVVQFEGTFTYWGVQPQIGWQYKPRDLTNLRVRAGALFFLQTQPDHPDFYTDLLALEFQFQHTFVHVPKLHIDLSATLGPYYDLNFGTLEPRTRVTGIGTYTFNKYVALLVSLRGISGEYLTYEGWAPVLPGRTKNMAIANIAFNFQLSKYFQLNVGGYVDERQFEPVGGLPGTLQEYYAKVGFKARWFTGVGEAPDEEFSGGGPAAFTQTPNRF